MRGKIRVLRRNSRCPKCGDFFEDIGIKGYVCPNCLTVPERFYLDINYRGQRPRIFSDKQGKPLDTFNRAFDLQAHISYEIDDGSFDPSKYIKSEQKEFYFSNRYDSWLKGKENDMAKGILAPSTLKAYRVYSRKYYIPFLKNDDIRDIRSGRIEQFFRQLPVSLSSKYIKCLVNTLENFFNAMLVLEYISKKPVFPKITVNEKIPKWTVREVQDRIISVIAEIDKDIFHFLTRQGTRIAEARALKIKDFNFKEGILLVQRTFSAGVLIERTKTKKEKYRLINPELLPMLRRLCYNRFPDEFVFINPRTKRPYCDKTLNNIWNEACKVAGVGIELYNATRHSIASQSSSGGAPLQAIKAVLGHTDIRTTLRYAMNDLSSQLIVFDKINKSLSTDMNRQQTVSGGKDDNKFSL